MSAMGSIAVVSECRLSAGGASRSFDRVIRPCLQAWATSQETTRGAMIFCSAIAVQLATEIRIALRAAARRSGASPDDRVAGILRDSVKHCRASFSRRFATGVRACRTKSIRYTAGLELRTRGSWVRILPGAPNKQGLAEMKALVACNGLALG